MELTFKGSEERDLELYSVTFSLVSRELSSATVLRLWAELLAFLLLAKPLNNYRHILNAQNYHKEHETKLTVNARPQTIYHDSSSEMIIWS